VEREIVEGHLSVCHACETEVDDLRAFRQETASFLSKEPLAVKAPGFREKLSAFLGRLAYSTPLRVAAAALVVLLIAVAATLPLRKQVADLRAQVAGLQEVNTALQQRATDVAQLQEQVAHLQQSQAQLLSQSPQITVALYDGGGLITLDKQGNLTGMELSPSTEQSVRAALVSGRVAPPRLAELSGKRGTLLGEGSEGVPFALVNPVGVIVQADRPTFRWRQLQGATRYTVRIFDSDFNGVMASAALTQTEWTPDEALERGRIYSWQVVAMKDGSEVISPAPPAPEAKFKVLGQAQADGLAQLKRTRPDSHLILGILYAEAGLLDEAEREFKALATANPRSPAARKLLDSILALK
jgi:hypothetical protein